MNAVQPEGVHVHRCGAEAIARLQPLWESLHDHHVAVAPHLRELGPVKSAAASWAVRAALYEEWLSEPDAFVMIADDRRAAIGYALVHMRGEEESWQTGPRIAELATLAVLPTHRGQRVGSRLMDCVFVELRRLGVTQLEVSVISTNADAIRFYHRLGLVPFCSSYIGAVPPPPSGGGANADR